MCWAAHKTKLRHLHSERTQSDRHVAQIEVPEYIIEHQAEFCIPSLCKCPCTSMLFLQHCCDERADFVFSLRRCYAMAQRSTSLPSVVCWINCVGNFLRCLLVAIDASHRLYGTNAGSEPIVLNRFRLEANQLSWSTLNEKRKKEKMSGSLSLCSS